VAILFDSMMLSGYQISDQKQQFHSDAKLIKFKLPDYFNKEYLSFAV